MYALQTLLLLFPFHICSQAHLFHLDYHTKLNICQQLDNPNQSKIEVSTLHRNTSIASTARWRNSLH